MQNNDMISRAAAIDAICGCFNIMEAHGVDMTVARTIVQNALDNAPAVDARPVVLCKDCRYAHMTYDGECKYCDFWQDDGGDALYLDGDFYCAAGERKDGGEDHDYTI